MMSPSKSGSPTVEWIKVRLGESAFDDAMTRGSTSKGCSPCDLCGAGNFFPFRSPALTVRIRDLLELAMEGRRRVKEQLKKMGSFEFFQTSFSYIDKDSGQLRWCLRLCISFLVLNE